MVAPGGGGDSISDAEFPQGGDDHDPFGDDTNNDMLGEDDDDSANRFRRRQSLQLSLSTHDGGSAAADEDVAGISFGSSLDASAVNNSAAKEIVLTGTKRRLSVRAGRRPNKRPRKVTTDSNHTELANEFIRTMLADTDDICREDENVIPTNETHDNADHDAFLLLYTTLSPTQLVCRPALADDGSLSNPLLKLWARNCNPVVGRPWDYASNDTDDVLTNGNAATIAAQNNEAASAVDTETETANKSKGDKSNGDDDDSSMEQARRGEGEEVEDFGRNGDDGDFPFADEDDAMRPEVDEEDRADNDPFEGNDKPLFDFDDDQDVRVDDSTYFLVSSYVLLVSLPFIDLATNNVFPSLAIVAGPVGNNDDRSIDSVFSLGATNGLDDVTFGNNSTNDNEGDERDDTTTTTTKWHRNTLKVFDVLKKNLGNADDSEHSVKETVSYNELTVGVSRRTAVGLFFELLQLKTLNYIELNQGESFGDITVSAGVKFMEEPPSA